MYRPMFLEIRHYSVNVDAAITNTKAILFNRYREKSANSMLFLAAVNSTLYCLTELNRV